MAPAKPCLGTKCGMVHSFQAGPATLVPLVGKKPPFGGARPVRGRCTADTSGMKNESGYSLIELLITMAVVAIALTMVVPGVQQFMQNNRLTSQLNMLSSSLMLARSEAVKRNIRAVICPSTDGATCVTTTGAGWETGWLVFLDRNNDFALTGTSAACAEGATTGECLLLAQEALTGGTTLRTASGIVGALAFDGSGTALCRDSAGSAQTCVAANTFLTLCDSRGASRARGLGISNTGRSSIIDKSPNGTSLSCP